MFSLNDSFGDSKTSKEIDLVENHGEVNGTYGDQGFLRGSKLAMMTEEDQAEGNEGKLPDPEIVTVQIHQGLDDGVELNPFLVQNHHGK
jgi:hypothetical protein